MKRGTALMKWMLFSTALFAALSFQAFQAEAAEMVVIASTAPGVAAGAMIKFGAKVTVPKGASVTLISQSGKALTLTGPFSGVPDAGGGAKDGAKGGGDLVKSLAGLISGGGKSSGSLGAMRAAPGAVSLKQNNPWVVNVGRSGNQCASAKGKVTLWRGKSSRATELKLKNLADKSRSKSAWPAGASTIDWPKGFPLIDGGTYLARLEGSRKAAKIVVHLVPGDLPTDAHKAVWMAGKGCVGQARLLLGLIR